MHPLLISIRIPQYSTIILPHSGIWQHTRKTKSDIMVQRIFSLNGIRLSGMATSGRRNMTGFTKFRNRKPILVEGFPLL
jgi:hypothetical protein